MAAVLIKGW
jgi:uncharacterized protein YjbI with pentapeptide repeats